MAEGAKHQDVKGSTKSQPPITRFFEKQNHANAGLPKSPSTMHQTPGKSAGASRDDRALDGPALDVDVVTVNGRLSKQNHASASKSKRRSTDDYLHHPTHPLSNKLAPLVVTNPRDGLLPYITRAEQNPEGRVVYFTDKWVFIRDKFAKGQVHFLLMSRDPEYFRRHPFAAFKDSAFLQEAKAEAQKGREIAASELRRKIGKYSATEKVRMDAMMADEAPEQLPQGRDWESEIMVGTHSWPSMTHLHIHIVSKDLSGEYMKSIRHYNTFATPFFVRLDEYPLADDDPRWHIEHCHHLAADAVCWHCGQNFGRRFKAFMAHLTQEFDGWKCI